MQLTGTSVKSVDVEILKIKTTYIVEILKIKTKYIVEILKIKTTYIVEWFKTMHGPPNWIKI